LIPRGTDHRRLKMRAGEPGWFYIGSGQLRYKDTEGWTDQFQDLDGPARLAPQVDVMSPHPADAKRAPKGKNPRRKTPALVIAVCAAVLGVGLLNPGVWHGWVSWATVQAGQIRP
jgi:hypothetical protein